MYKSYDVHYIGIKKGVKRHKITSIIAESRAEAAHKAHEEYPEYQIEELWAFPTGERSPLRVLGERSRDEEFYATHPEHKRKYRS